MVDHQRRDRITAEVDRWLNAVVLGLNLCPFARKPVDGGQVRVSVSTARGAEALLSDLLSELQHLDSQPPATTETTLLVIPDYLPDFLDFNQFLDLAEALLEQYGYAGVYQLATFHPHYQFAGTDAGDAENLTNRAPYPILHLLREASIEGALAGHPDPEGIPAANIRRVEALTPQQIRALFPYLDPAYCPPSR
ncbi:DUF1415 family protein [Parahaliea mediterranea]|uniref:DUF1415 domain-containing protein n=1 Tax=Parahaliea mediterranea TaxID=651086 RepID=A0A939DI76_9GAMM|nr:DUF1415 domain-containing protein [Parahaliea mediterranea]